MVYQVRAGYAEFGMEIKVPQTFIPGVMRGIIKGKTQYLTDVLNVIHATAGAAPVTQGQCEAFALALDDWVQTEYRSLFSAKITYEGVHVRSMEGLEVPKATVSVTGVVGAIGGDPLPTFTSLPVLLETGNTGIANHGMFHVWYPSETENDATSTPTAVYQTAVADAMQALIVALDGVGIIPIIASFRYGQYRLIENISVRNYWGTINHRKVGQGR